MAEDVRVEVTAGGPYVMYGPLPLLEMAPVHTFNGEPVAWHTLGALPASGGRVELCRCGQSSTRPFCDSTHERIGFDGTETADRRPYTARAIEDREGDLALADDHPLCAGAGFCGTRTTDVWTLLHASADPAVRERVREMIGNCPSGRLVLRERSADLEPPLEAGIAVVPGGPLWVRGGVPVVGADGVPWETRNRVTLCRCGRSQNKPFCDESHVDAHFDER